MLKFLKMTVAEDAIITEEALVEVLVVEEVLLQEEKVVLHLTDLELKVLLTEHLDVLKALVIHQDQEDQEDRKSSTSPLEPYVLLWNSTLHPLGYGKCEKITPKRIAALSARLRQDPEYFTTFSRAVDYLSRDEWWRGKAKQFTIDLLIDQAGRAQELSEKTPSTPPVKSYNSRTADIDDMFIQQMQALGYN